MDIRQLQAEIRGSHEEVVLLAVREIGTPDVQPGEVRERTALSREEVHFAAQELRQKQLAVSDVSFGGEITLTPAGNQLADMIVASRRSGPDRWEAVQLEVLRICEQSGSVPDGTTSVGGAVMTRTEINDAASFLEAHGLLTATRAWGGDVVLAQLTYSGRRALATGSVSDYLRSTAMSSVINDHSMNVTASNASGPINVVGGHGNTVTITQELTDAKRVEVARLVNEAIDALPESDETREVRGELEKLSRSALQPAETKATLGQKIVRLVESPAAIAVIGLLSQALGVLG